jgi:hypothetical protein
MISPANLSFNHETHHAPSASLTPTGLVGAFVAPAPDVVPPERCRDMPLGAKGGVSERVACVWVGVAPLLGDSPADRGVDMAAASNSSIIDQAVR